MKREMTVNINGLRRNTAIAYTKLVNILHENTYDGGEITVTADELQDAMDSLRQGITAFMCVYLEADDKFSDISEETDKIPHFNEEPEGE